MAKGIRNRVCPVWSSHTLHVSCTVYFLFWPISGTWSLIYFQTIIEIEDFRYVCNVDHAHVYLKSGLQSPSLAFLLRRDRVIFTMTRLWLWKATAR